MNKNGPKGAIRWPLARPRIAPSFFSVLTFVKFYTLWGINPKSILLDTYSLLRRCAKLNLVHNELKERKEK
jgi:hypothetical protein